MLYLWQEEFMNLYDLKVTKRDGEELSLASLKGKVLLIVNTATGCGFTPQYEALEDLYKKYHEKGLEILDFPCNQFGHQAPGDDNEIHEFCTAKYNTTFDQLKKVDVNGENEDSVFTYIKENSPKEYIKGLKNKLAMGAIKKMSTTCTKESDILWNFTKFLVDQEGNVVIRVSPIESPNVMEDKISELLK
jgi:glutathione peroxidase